MTVKARAEITLAVVNDGKSANTFWRYSDDNGKTMTKAATSPTPDAVKGDNQFAYDQPYNSNVTGSSVSLFTEAERGELVLGTSVGYHVTAGGGNGGVFFYQDAAHRLLFGKTGTPLVLSCYMRAVGGAANVSIGIEGRSLTPFNPLTKNWQRFEIKTTSDDQGHALLFYAYNACKFDLCCIQFAQGQGVDTWQPAPKDAAIGTTAGKYLGVVSWDKPYPPMNSTLYQWTKVEGKDAELYRLHALEEAAIVDDKGACKITLRYEVHHIVGDFSEKYTGNDVTIKADGRVGNLNFTKKPTGEWECVTTIADFAKKQLGSFNVSIQKGVQVMDTRVVAVTYDTQALLEANQKLGEVVASVKGVSKLIHNMFVGSTFLEPIEGVWSMNGASVDKNVKYNNANVVFIEEHGQAADTYHSLMFVVEGCAPKKKYTVSAMIRTDNLGSFTNGKNGAGLEVVMVDNGNRVRLFDPVSIVPAKANEWQKFEHTFTTPDNLTSQKIEVKFIVWRNGRLWVSQPMMNAGEVAADYTANVKDIQLSLAQIKVTANTISQSITDLGTGLELVGIHLNGEKKRITLNGDTEFIDTKGNFVALFKDGKIITEAIDVDKVVADGIQSKTIDAKNATFDNINVSGNINASSGKIAGFKISGNGLTNDPFTNDAYIVFRNDRRKSFAGFGGNVLPASSGAKAIARFENCDEGDFFGIGTNYAVLLAARGMRENIAMEIDGGALSGVAMRNTIIDVNETSRTLGRFDYNVIAINNNDCVITLPEMMLHDDGHVVRIKRLGTGMLKIALGECYTYDGTQSRYSLPYMSYDNDITLFGNYEMELRSRGDAMEFVWVRDISRTYIGNTYYGAWLGYRLQ